MNNRVGTPKSRLIDVKTAETLLQQNAENKDYPLTVIAKFGVRDRRPPNLPLTLDSLVEWLAAYCGMPYFDIDPLRANGAAKVVEEVTSIEEVMRMIF